MDHARYYAPSHDLCASVVRMAMMGWHPAMIEVCTAIPQPFVCDIIKSHFTSGPDVQRAPVAIAAPVYAYPAPYPWYGGYPQAIMPPPHYAAPAPHVAPVPPHHPHYIHPQPLAVAPRPVEVPRATIVEVTERAPQPDQPPPPPERPVSQRSLAPSRHTTSLKQTVAQKPYPNSKPAELRRVSGSTQSVQALTLGVGQEPKVASTFNLIETSILAPGASRAHRTDLVRSATVPSRSEAGGPVVRCDHHRNSEQLVPRVESPGRAPTTRHSVIGIQPFVRDTVGQDNDENEDQVQVDEDADGEQCEDDGDGEKEEEEEEGKHFSTLSDEDLADEGWPKEDHLVRRRYAYTIGRYPYCEIVFIAQFNLDVSYGWAIPGRVRRSSSRSHNFTISFAISSNGILTSTASEKVGRPTYGNVIRRTMEQENRLLFVLSKYQVEDFDQLKLMFKNRSMKYVFIPVQCPDYDVVKLARAWVEQEVQEQETELGAVKDVAAAKDIVKHAIKSITREQAKQWFKKCHYI